MTVRKLLAVATLAGLVASAAACSDVTGPEQNTGVCQVSSGSGTCIPGT
ncbi:MAG TPA: hypothetical protein VM166_05450 [Gemmatimonadaceae bacterium]|nr:hypothetical protein [Gemmatimonadaceae bacterium]